MYAASSPAPARRQTFGPCGAAAWALAAGLAYAVPASAADPDALWKIVHNRCVPNQQQHRHPGPCAKVDLTSGVRRGDAVLKDITGATQFLLIPTARVTGIESPALLAPGAPNYWASAWQARRYVVARAPRPLRRDEIGLAINSAKGRSQNQLHIHVDCVRPDVRSYLVEHAADLPRQWSDMIIRFDGHRYRVLRLDRVDLRGVNPFVMLARNVATARADMGNWTLVVIGIEPRGFVVLAGHVDAATNDDGSGEELLDHDCALAHALR